MQPDGLDEGQRAALCRLQRAQLREARRIRQAVADGYGVPVAHLCAPGRTRAVSEARQVAMHAMRARLLWPLAVRNAPVPFGWIGALLGERDHSTIMHGVAAITPRSCTASPPSPRAWPATPRPTGACATRRGPSTRRSTPRMRPTTPVPPPRHNTARGRKRRRLRPRP